MPIISAADILKTNYSTKLAITIAFADSSGLASATTSARVGNCGGIVMGTEKKFGRTDFSSSSGCMYKSFFMKFATTVSGFSPLEM